MFLVRKGEIEGRIEPFYYIPEIVALENKVRKVSSQRLKDFIVSIASGATPSVREEEKFYSDAENGVPFIRVQNLSHTNELMLNDLKYINYETHNKYLNRSQIKPGNLLVKITGVGRMAVSSLVPTNFEGNINQHLVVIKTTDSFTSEVLATFLNTDIAEKLASRRATGGTRPALDYAALKSMPIIFKPEIVEIIKKAVVAKRQKETEAAGLLASIDGYLLQALGIILQPSSEKKPFFYTRVNKVSGGRFDPKKYVPENEQLIELMSNGKYKGHPLKEFLIQSVSGDWGIDEAKEGFLETLVIRATEFDNYFNLKLDNSRVKYRFINQIKLEKMDLRVNDLLIEKSGGSENQPVGRIAIITEELADNYALSFSNFIHKIRVDARINSNYLFGFLKTAHNIKITDLMQSQTNGIRNLIMKEYLNIQIPLPPLEKQIEIANHISALRTQAKHLRLQAEIEFNSAKQTVEKMILGEA